MRLCTCKTRSPTCGGYPGLGSGSGREGKPGLLTRPLIELPVAIAVLTLLAAVLAPVTAAASPTAWTLILQLPAGRALRVERGRETLRGPAAPLLRRLRRSRGAVRAVRRVVAGTISIDSRRVENLQLAGQMLIVTVLPSPTTRVHIVSTNRLPLTEDPSHRALVDLQILAGNELHARAPFAVVDERGRTAVLFQ